MLWLALHLPQLPLEVHTRSSDRPLPAVVSTQSGQQSFVLSVNLQAHRGGVYPGMTLAAAHALIAGLHAYRRDEQGEAAALRHLATLAITYTPIVSIAAPRTVLLEIEGSLKLFGGAERLQQRLHAEVRRLGYAASIAIAPTAFGAELLARANRAVIARDLDTLRAALHQLPLSVFDLPAEQHTALRDLGVRTLRELMRLPRAGLARRFGMALVDNMDRALGHRPDPRPQFKTPEQFASTLHFPDAVTDAEALLFTARRQLQELSAFLLARCAGVRTITWQLTHWRKSPSVLRIEAALVHRNARRFLDLLREQLHRQPLAGSVESITLQTDQLTAYEEENASLLTGQQRQPTHERALLVERLRARLGGETVQGINPVDDHRPEFAQQLSAITLDPASANHRLVAAHRLRRKTHASGSIITSSLRTSSSRPLWLLPEPTLLAAPPVSQGMQPQWQGALTLETGPERIETGWWDGRPIARDYYIAHSQNGSRMWIYRERSGFTRGHARSRLPLAHAGTSGITPRWFLHGLFS